MPVFDNDDEIKEIPRNWLLTVPKIIMYKLVFEYIGETSQKKIKKSLKRGNSQGYDKFSIDFYYNNLVKSGLIKLHRNGEKKMIRATELGMIYAMECMNNSFKKISIKISEFIDYFNLISKLGEIDVLILTLINIDHINSAFKNQSLFQEVLKKMEIRIERLRRDIMRRLEEKKRTDSEKLIKLKEDKSKKELEIDEEKKIMEMLDNKTDLVYSDLYEVFPNIERRKIRYYYKKWQEKIMGD